MLRSAMSELAWATEHALQVEHALGARGGSHERLKQLEKSALRDPSFRV